MRHCKISLLLTWVGVQITAANTPCISRKIYQEENELFWCSKDDENVGAHLGLWKCSLRRKKMYVDAGTFCSKASLRACKICNIDDNSTSLLHKFFFLILQEFELFVFYLPLQDPSIPTLNMSPKHPNCRRKMSVCLLFFDDESWPILCNQHHVMSLV